MNRTERWNQFFQDSKYPCFMADAQTNALICVNDEFLQSFNLDNSIIGKKFFEFINSDSSDIDLNTIDWPTTTHSEISFYDADSSKSYTGTITLSNSKEAIFCRLTPNHFGKQSQSFEKAMERCIEIHQCTSEKFLISFMELICDFYEAERAYLYRYKRSDSSINCIAQWCVDPNFIVTPELGEKVGSDFFINWMDEHLENGVVVYSRGDENSNNDTVANDLLNTFDIDNMILSKVDDINRQFTGFIGISNHNIHKPIDVRLIALCSKFVSQEVSKTISDESLLHMQHFDSLTGFFNRAGYASKIDKIMKSPPNKLGIISVNVNGLKYINETSGIASGDEHIRECAERLAKHFTEYEFYRMSGDEFIGLAMNVEKSVFEKSVVQLHDEMHKEFSYSFSMGHAWNEGAYDFAKLILEAETVMYINKQEYYSATQRHFSNVNDVILSNLLSHLADNEFMIYLQPQVKLEDGSLYGAEALIRRFDKKNNRMVFPDQFISLYEQKSVIRHVDIFVIETVCELLSKWIKIGKTIPVSVNLSRVTLQEYGIVDTITQICDKYQVPHELLVIEVTERVGLVENNVASSLIREFKENGFQISLDDFGCAYSNIVTLAQIEVDEVKIDKSLVDDLTTSKKNHILVKNVLSMCNELDGTSTLAEGIEDENQAKMLHSLGCHLGQGYFYSRPIPINEFNEKYIV